MVKSHLKVKVKVNWMPLPHSSQTDCPASPRVQKNRGSRSICAAAGESDSCRRVSGFTGRIESSHGVHLPSQSFVFVLQDTAN